MKKNKIEKDKEQGSFSYIGTGSIKFSGSAKVSLVLTFYKKNVWLLVLALFLIGIISLIGFFVRPLWSFIINIVVGLFALFFIPNWKIKNISEKSSGD